MTNHRMPRFEALGRCVDHAYVTARNGPDGLADRGHHELWGARGLADAVELILASALWESERDDEHATVPKHDLVLLEAAFDAATGRRARTVDGFPHAGVVVSGIGVCNAGYCPCHDGRRPPQPALLDHAA